MNRVIDSLYRASRPLPRSAANDAEPFDGYGAGDWEEAAAVTVRPGHAQARMAELLCRLQASLGACRRN